MAEKKKAKAAAKAAVKSAPKAKKPAAKKVAKKQVAPEVAKSAASAQCIRIKLKSFDQLLLDQSVARIVETGRYSGATVVGPVPLPTKKRKWCILKSPHVDKRGGEHWELSIHSRFVDILDPPSATVNSLMELDLPSGVDIEVRQISR
ncbi:MAG: 30S ribosomal protein S10 [Flavobacteriaceae bacterium]|jgi:small subunit ribosomal protein S10|nr:30S ribosomal protein S10 [Flavobacteriaceae bacterium]